jgi:hypothetical protein
MSSDNTSQETKYEMQQNVKDCMPMTEMTSHAVKILYRGCDRTSGERGW